MQAKTSGKAETSAAGSWRGFVFAGMAVATLSLTWPLKMAAQIPGAAGSARARVGAAGPDYGTSNLTFVRVTGQDFQPAVGAYGQVGLMGRYPLTDSALIAGLQLPDGSIVDYLELDFFDLIDPQDIHFYLYDCPVNNSACNEIANVNSFGQPGMSAISTSGFSHQVNNAQSAVVLYATFQAYNNDSLAIMGAAVGYRLQVSPPPAIATFNDVPTTHPFFQFIEALNASGITAGCGGGNFCPDQPLTRGQMAVFLAKALGLSFN